MGDSHACVNDGDKLYIGPGGSYITESSDDLILYDPTVAAEKTLTQLVAGGGVSTLDEAFDGGNAIDDATTDAAGGLQIGDGTNYISIYEGDDTHVYLESSVGDIKFISAGGDVTFDNDNVTTTGVIEGTGGIGITADDVNLTLGASGATDSKMFYSNANGLTFYDQIYGSNITLSQLAMANLNSPTVTGDMDFTDGKLTIVDASDETALIITADAVTTNSVLTISGDGVTTGNGLYISLTEATLSGGKYINLYDETGPASVWSVGEDGNQVIAGTAAGTDALTLTTGDLTISSGDLGVAIGVLTVADTADSANKISRNNATGTNPVLEVEQTHATGGIGLLVDQNATGDVDAMQVTNAGTGFAISTTAGAAGSEGFEYIAAASGTGVGFRGDGSTGSWIGAADVGFIDIDTDGALAAGANLLRLDCTGTNEQHSFVCEILSSGKVAGATDGVCLNVVESGAATATSYAVRIASTSNEALHVDSGLSLFDERVTITLVDNTGPALAITNPDISGDTNAVTIVPSGAGAGIAITPQEADTQGLLITTVASSTVPLLDIDATTGAGWIGGADAGCIDVTCDGAIVADGTLLRLASSGQPAAANDGICIDVKETGAAQATSYAVRISSTSNEALHIDAGVVLVDETVTASKGVITLALDTDVTNPPTDAELDDVTDAQNQVDGCMIFVDDAGGHANAYLCIHDGTKWWQLTMTACA